MKKKKNKLGLSDRIKKKKSPETDMSFVFLVVCFLYICSQSCQAFYSVFLHLARLVWMCSSFLPSSGYFWYFRVLAFFFLHPNQILYSWSSLNCLSLFFYIRNLLFLWFSFNQITHELNNWLFFIIPETCLSSCFSPQTLRRSPWHHLILTLNWERIPRCSAQHHTISL